MQNSWEVIIIGGGPAGLSAALMLGRARRRTLVLDAGQPRNRFSDQMHGVLGREGTDPAELIADGRREAACYGIEFADAPARAVTRTPADLGSVGQFQVTTDGPDAATHTADAIIVATGLTDVLPDVPGLAERWGASVLHCPYCHGWEYGDRRLGLLATGPMDLHRAEMLRQWSEDLTVFVAGVGPVDDSVRTRLGSRGVKLVDAAVVEVAGPGRELAEVVTDDGARYPIDALFTGADLRPQDEFLASLDLTRQDGPMGSFVQVDQFGATSEPGVFAVGNVVNPGATVPVSMGAGSMAGGLANMHLIGREFDAAEQAPAATPA